LRRSSGSLEIEKSAGEGAFTVFLNGERIRSPARMLKKVLNGTYALTVRQNRLLGDTEIFRQEVTVIEEQSTRVAFSIPGATDDERAALEARARGLRDSAASAHELAPILEQILQFQRETGAVEYDPALEAERTAVMKEAGDRAVALLDQAVQRADAAFYAEKPDFKTALESYATFASAINTPYKIEEIGLAGSPGTRAPRLLASAPDGTLYVIHGTEDLLLSAIAPGGTGNGEAGRPRYRRGPFLQSPSRGARKLHGRRLLEDAPGAPHNPDPGTPAWLLGPGAPRGLPRRAPVLFLRLDSARVRAGG
jgi:cytochrome c556